MEDIQLLSPLFQYLPHESIYLIFHTFWKLKKIFVTQNRKKMKKLNIRGNFFNKNLQIDLLRVTVILGSPTTKIHLSSTFRMLQNDQKLILATEKFILVH